MDCEISTKSLHTNVLFTQGLKEGWTQCKFTQVKKDWVNNEINTATTRRKKLLKSFPFVILNTNNIIIYFISIWITKNWI